MKYLNSMLFYVHDIMHGQSIEVNESQHLLLIFKIKITKFIVELTHASFNSLSPGNH